MLATEEALQDQDKEPLISIAEDLRWNAHQFGEARWKTRARQNLWSFKSNLCIG